MFAFLHVTLFYMEKVSKFQQIFCKMRMKKMLNEGNQIHSFISSSGSGTVINYGSGYFLSSYGSGSTSPKVTVPTVTVPVPQRCLEHGLHQHAVLEDQPSVFVGGVGADVLLYHAGFRIRIRINLSCCIRIRIQIADPDLDPGGQKWPTKVEKSNFHVFKYWMFSFEG
jgi:hypothetical protein